MNTTHSVTTPVDAASDEEIADEVLGIIETARKALLTVSVTSSQNICYLRACFAVMEFTNVRFLHKS